MKYTLLFVSCLLLGYGCSSRETRIDKVVLVSANAEWKVVKDIFPHEAILRSPWGEYFVKDIAVGDATEPVIFFHGGWGKVAAAGSTQYCIDRWTPTYLINIGTCGGFEGEIKKLEIVLVDKTVI